MSVQKLLKSVIRGLVVVAAFLAGSGAYAWTVPTSASSTCHARGSDPSGATSDVSDAAFQIVSCGEIGLVRTSQEFRAEGGNGTVGVTAGSGCAWTAVSDAPWVTITAGADGTGNGLVTYLVAANSASTPRTGTLTVGGNTFTVSQARGTQRTYALVRTVQVTPDATFRTGSFARINLVPAAGRFVVTFGTKLDKQGGDCQGAGYAYKEYFLDLQETGRAGDLVWYPDECEAGDSGSVMVGDTYYLATVPQGPGFSYGWQLTRFDAVGWATEAAVSVTLTSPGEGNLDPTVAWVNGELDVSDQYNAEGIWQEGAASHYRFFSADLQSEGTMILADSPHISGASMIFVDGVYYILSAHSYTGGLVVLKYDSHWGYLGMKDLINEAHWPQGVAFDGRLFHVAYLDTSLRTPQTFFPVYPNVHLAAFDRDWNLVDDVAVTSFALSDNKKGGRPWVILHDNRLYVSYDVDTVDPVTQEENLEWQAYVSIYELVRPRVRRHLGRADP